MLTNADGGRITRGMKVARERKPTPTKRPQSDPQQRVLPEDNSRAGSKRDWATSSFLRPKPHPNQPGWAGGFKKRVPTTLQQGRTIENYAVDAQQRLTASSGARAWYSFITRLGPKSELNFDNLNRRSHSKRRTKKKV